MNEDSNIFSKEEISSYLSEVKKAIRDKKYTFSSREKNKKLFIDYIIDEKKRLEIIYNLTVDDFCYLTLPMSKDRGFLLPANIVD